MKKNIALLAGGYTGEYEISIKTAVTIEQNIDADLYNVYKIILDRDDWVYTSSEGVTIPVNRSDFSLTIDEQKITFDAVFIAVHGTPGEDGKIQGYLEMLGIPFTSCNAIVSGITFNKVFCNHIVAHSGIVNVSKNLHLLKGKVPSLDILQNAITLPAFIKPAEGGSSLATTKVKTPHDIMPALEAVFEFDHQAMIEEFIGGKEFSIGVYRKGNDVIALPCTEIISSKEFFDYEAKYTPGVSNEVTPANISSEEANEIASTAKKIYELLCCKGVCRIDFIREQATGKLFFLEINTVPGQSENSIVPQQVRASGLTLKAFYGNLLEETLKS